MPARKRVTGRQQTVVESVDKRSGGQVIPVKPVKTTHRFDGVETERWASVSFGLSLTKNLGNYESIKMTVMLTRPCADTPEAIEEKFSEVLEFVHQKIGQANETYGPEPS